jgi:hypothetical protein
MKKWANELDRVFSKEVQITKKYMKNCSISLVIKEMQIKITLRFHLTVLRMAMKIQTTNVEEDMGEKKTLFTVGGNVN